MTIAITGLPGQLGRLIVQALRTRAPHIPIIGLARSPEKAADLRIEVRRFDYDDPATLAPALAGVTTLMFVSGSAVGQRERQHRNVVTAAQAAGVGHIVYTSLLHADTSTLSLAGEHRKTEAMLAKSGVAHTILRNGWYTENYTQSVPPALAHGASIGSAGEGRIAAAARADYAEAAAVVLADGGHAGRTYELAGDTAFTLADLAAELSRQAGRAIPYVDLPEADYAAALVGAGLPEPFAGALASYDRAAAGGALFDDGRALSALIGRPTTPLSASIAAALPA
ncbi:SDR family oxidoreductase [Sphingomonas sp. RP10(2022)]|uniref:SDR family oxidoreductase n=1 Tax=Sphingomonas liriopis TaxID=2949094 RepID=A0A9X2HYV2_9SPHN|nr:SDR family oxidoreductase [Sphingomonas liriopis]MCP3735949.1 SDR family oxidoreductase [Sphingomonas liriopis]